MTLRNAARFCATAASGADCARTAHEPRTTNNPSVLIPVLSYDVARLKSSPTEFIQALRKFGGRYAPLCRLFERIRQLDEARFAAGAARKANADRRGLRIEARRKRRLRRVRRKTERYDHSRIAGLCGDTRTCRSDKQQRIEPFPLHHRVNTFSSRHPHVLRAIGEIPGAIAIEINLV